MGRGCWSRPCYGHTRSRTGLGVHEWSYRPESRPTIPSLSCYIILGFEDAITILSLYPQFPPCLLSGLAVKDVNADDVQPVQVESDDTKKEMAKLSFPVVEADMSPVALIPKACQSLQKYSVKLNTLLAPFLDAAPGTLTDLQERKLVMSIGGILFEVISKKKKHIVVVHVVSYYSVGIYGLNLLTKITYFPQIDKKNSHVPMAQDEDQTSRCFEGPHGP